MSYESRRFLTPGASRKRKEREAFHSSNPSTPVTSKISDVNKLSPTTSYKPLSSNKLLAGYLACEFLSKGTLLGQKFDRAEAEPVPVSSSSLAEPSGGNVKPQKERYYPEVASLLKSDGSHIPGIVNPTQLARWIQM